MLEPSTVSVPIAACWTGYAAPGISDYTTHVSQPVFDATSPKQIELLLSAADLAETQVALEPVAVLAKRLRYRTLAATSCLSIAAVVAATAGAATGHGLAGGVVGTMFGVGAIAAIARCRTIWKGALKPVGLNFPASVFPTATQTLLDDVRRGAVRVRFATNARPLEHYPVLPRAEANGPFAPLLLSPDPAVSGLALWSLFAGDKLSVLFEAVGQRKNATEGYNRFILLSAEELEEILAIAFPPDVSDAYGQRYHTLVSHAFRTAQHLLATKSYKGMKPLVSDVCEILKRREGIHEIGLRPGSDSESWMNAAFSSGGYAAINEKLEQAEAELAALLTQKEVMLTVGVSSRETIARWVRQGCFPPPIIVGGGQLRWLRVEVDEWVLRRAEARAMRHVTAPPISSEVSAKSKKRNGILQDALLSWAATSRG